MKLILKIIASIGLMLTIIPSFLVFQGTISLEVNKILMFLGVIIWFFTAPFLINQKPEDQSVEKGREARGRI